MQDLQTVGVTAEHVAQGRMQFGLQDWVDVRKNPSMQDVQPAALQFLQFVEH